MKKIYNHVEINYFNPDTHFWCVDAWKNDEDEGRVVGVIHESGDAYIYDPDAIICENVNEAVAGKVAIIKAGQIKANGDSEPEVVDVRLDPVSHPRAYATKKKELMDSGMTEQEAEEALRTPFTLELYYSKDNGLFAVESEALEYGSIRNPYDGVLIDNE